MALVLLLIGHLGVAFFLCKIIALTRGDQVGLAVGVGYALLFPFICWLGYGLGTSPKHR